MKAHEFVIEKKKRKRSPRWAAYGPGPYGGYGYAVGYSGDSGSDSGGSESIKYEASYPGNIGMMELAKFFSTADEEQKTLFKQLLEKGKKGLAWKLVQDIVGVKLHGKEFGNDLGEDQHPNERPRGSESKPTMPAGTVRVDVSDVYDWYKLGQHISNLKGLGKHDFGKGPPSTIVSFGSEEEEHQYLKDLEKIGLTTTDIDPVDPNQPKGMKRQKTDPTYNVGENFADGKNPGRKGLAKRSGVNTKASVSSLRKTAKNSSGEKARMAHWLANMKAGRAKKS